MPTFEETINATGTDVSQIVTGNISGGSNMLYIVSHAARRSSAISSISGGGLTWNAAKHQCGGRDQQGGGVWYAFGSPASAFAITVNLVESTAAVVVIVCRYSGASGVIEDATGHNTVGENGACSGGTDGTAAQLTTGSTEANSMHFVALGPRGRTIDSFDSDYTQRGSLIQAGGGGDLLALAVYDYQKAATGDDTFTATLSNTSDWHTAGMVIKPAGGGAVQETLSFTAVLALALADLAQYLEGLTFTASKSFTLADLAQYLESPAFAASQSLALADIQKYIEALPFNLQQSQTVADLKKYLEALVFTQAELFTVDESQLKKEILAYIQAAAITSADIQTFIETVNMIAAQLVAAADAQTYLERPAFTQAQAHNIGDFQKYIEALPFISQNLYSIIDLKKLVEALAFSQLQLIGSTDRQVLKEILGFDQIAAITSADIQKYIAALFLNQISAFNVTAFQNYVEALAVISGKVFTLLDLQKYKEVLTVDAAAVFDVVDTLIGFFAEHLEFIQSQTFDAKTQQTYLENLAFAATTAASALDLLRAVERLETTASAGFTLADVQKYLAALAFNFHNTFTVNDEISPVIKQTLSTIFQMVYSLIDRQTFKDSGEVVSNQLITLIESLRAAAPLAARWKFSKQTTTRFLKKIQTSFYKVSTTNFTLN